MACWPWRKTPNPLRKASVSIAPHSGVGARAPRPRKESAATSRMAVASVSVACPESTFGLDVVTFPDAYYNGPDDARNLGYEHDAHGQHRVRQARAEDRDDDNGEQDARESEEHVHHAHE